MTAGVIEYFYSAHSAFAYIGSARLAAIAGQAGRRLIHRPIHLGPVVEAVGGKTFAQRTPEHHAYFFGREIERWAAFRSVPVIDFRPTHHDADMTLASTMLIAAQDLGLDVDSLAHRILEVHWRDDADISDETTLSDVARACAMDPSDVLAKARAPATQDAYRQNTSNAIERSVFGSPTYFVDGDMFYGQDHLELIELALQNTP